MQPKLFGAFFLQYFICLLQLLCSHAVFRITGIIHDIVADFKESAGIIAAAYSLRDMPDCFLQKADMGNIVQIDDCPQLVRKLKVLRRCIVGGEHDMLPANVKRIG